MNADGLLALLQEENIESWFDLGLFLDRLKEKYASLMKRSIPEPRKGSCAIIGFIKA